MGHRKAQLGRVTDVDLRLLRIFQTVVYCGGLSAAEIDLGIGRSTISTHIAELEARLGTRLCQRGRSGFALTASGKKIYEASLDLMRSLDAFRNEVNTTQDAMTGELNIGLVDNIIWDKEARLSQVFGEFSSRASEIDLTLYVLSPDEIERRLIDGRLHIGIAPVMHELPSLSYEHLFDEVNYLYCGREHSLFNRPDSEVTTADLIQSQYIKKGYAVCNDLQQANVSMGKRVVGFHVESFALLILSGRYIGFLPEHYAGVWESKGEMRRLLPQRYEARVSFAAMTARGKTTTVAQTAFLDTLLAVRDAGDRRKGVGTGLDRPHVAEAKADHLRVDGACSRATDSDSRAVSRNKVLAARVGPPSDRARGGEDEEDGASTSGGSTRRTVWRARAPSDAAGVDLGVPARTSRNDALAPEPSDGAAV